MQFAALHVGDWILLHIRDREIMRREKERNLVWQCDPLPPLYQRQLDYHDGLWHDIQGDPVRWVIAMML